MEIKRTTTQSFFHSQKTIIGDTDSCKLKGIMPPKYATLEHLLFAPKMDNKVSCPKDTYKVVIQALIKKIESIEPPVHETHGGCGG